MDPNDDLLKKPSAFLWNRGGVRIATPEDLWGPRKFRPKPQTIQKAFLNKEEWYKAPVGSISQDFHSNTEVFPAEENRMPRLVIDLELPDHVLRASFETLLNFLRTQPPWEKVKAFDAYLSPQKWYEYSILPFWDLKTWADETGTKWTKVRMIEKIFADKFIPVDRRIEDRRMQKGKLDRGKTGKRKMNRRLADQNNYFKLNTVHLMIRMLFSIRSHSVFPLTRGRSL